MAVIHNQQEKIQKLVEVTIAKDASLSGVIDCRGFRVAKIYMPSAWTTADLTFQESAAGTTFGELADDGGITVTAEASDSAVIVPMINALAFNDVCYLKIRSGTSSTAVTQGAERVVKVLLSSL